MMTCLALVYCGRYQDSVSGSASASNKIWRGGERNTFEIIFGANYGGGGGGRGNILGKCPHAPCGATSGFYWTSACKSSHSITLSTYLDTLNTMVTKGHTHQKCTLPNETALTHAQIYGFTFLNSMAASLFWGSWPPTKSCLVVLHCLPLIYENWKTVFTVQKCTTPNFQNSKKKKKGKKRGISPFFFFENLDLLKILFKLLLSTCLHFKTGLKLVYEEIFSGKAELFAPSLGDKEAIILCSFDFDLKTKNLPAHTYSKKSCGGQPKIIFLGGGRLIGMSYGTPECLMGMVQNMFVM